MLGLLGALDPYKHKLNQTGGVLVDGDSAAISKDMTDSDAGNTKLQWNLFTPDKVMSTNHSVSVTCLYFVFSNLFFH